MGNLFSWLISPYMDGRTYKNILYLLLSFPLGMLYFVAFTVGVSLGFSLLVLCIGIPILFAVMVGAAAAVRLERVLANGLMDAGIPLDDSPLVTTGSLKGYLSGTVLNVDVWKGIGYLLIKFPFGIAAFILTITALSSIAAMILTPLSFMLSSGTSSFGAGYVNTLPEAFLAALMGVVLGTFLLHLVNLVSSLWRALTIQMLYPSMYVPGRYVQIPTEPQEKPKRAAVYDDERIDTADRMPDKPKNTPPLHETPRTTPEPPTGRSLADLIQRTLEDEDQDTARR
ncbi:MAG: hypothetical protein OHK0046_08910 [Anaerolineae bacterium]